MTSGSSAHAHEQYAELAAGYALGALEPEDEAVFVAHLATCDECTTSTAAFSDVAGELAGVSDDIPAPAGLWSGIHKQIGADTPTTTAVTPLDEHRRTRSGRRFSGRFPAVAAAAASVAVIAVASITAINVFSGSDTSPSDTAISDCARDSGCQAIDLVDAGNQTDAVALVRGNNVTLVSTGLATIDPSSETYVLWQMPTDGQPASVLAFAVTSESKHPVAAGHLPLPTAPGTRLALSHERGTAIPAAPSAPVATTSSA